jgi:hypothetical protein
MGWRALLFGTLISATAGAAESAAAPSVPSASKKRFDIPAGEAFTTLKRFTEQSGGQLIYKADSIEGVRTDAVRGRYTPLEALSRMLLRTELAITQDAKTGTLAIRPASGSGAGSRALPPKPEPNSAAKKKSPPP